MSSNLRMYDMYKYDMYDGEFSFLKEMTPTAVERAYSSVRVRRHNQFNASRRGKEVLK